MSNFSLTDEEMKKNWDEYGNPDGPGGLHLVICSITLFWKSMNHLQTSLLILSEYKRINFYPQLNYQKAIGFLMISGEIEVN